MALTWDLGKIDGYKEVCFIPEIDLDGTISGDKQMNPVTEVLIWTTMLVGINQITDKTYVDFYKRIKLLEETGSHLLSGTDEKGNLVESNPSLQDIYFHRGLSTNATRWTEKQFCKRLGERLLENVTRNIKEEVKEFKNDSIIETIAV